MRGESKSINQVTLMLPQKVRLGTVEQTTKVLITTVTNVPHFQISISSRFQLFGQPRSAVGVPPRTILFEQPVDGRRHPDGVHPLRGRQRLLLHRHVLLRAFRLPQPAEDRLLPRGQREPPTKPPDAAGGARGHDGQRLSQGGGGAHSEGHLVSMRLHRQSGKHPLHVRGCDQEKALRCF